MLKLLACLTLLTPTMALAQTAAPASGVVQRAALTLETPIETIMADPAGNALLAKEMPTLVAHPMYDQFKSLTLPQLQQFSPAVTDEKLAKVAEGLKALGGK